jgi:hypothetical protein
MLRDIHQIRAVQLRASKVDESLAEVISMRHEQCNADDRERNSEETLVEDAVHAFFGDGVKREDKNGVVSRQV